MSRMARVASCWVTRGRVAAIARTRVNVSAIYFPTVQFCDTHQRSGACVSDEAGTGGPVTRDRSIGISSLASAIVDLCTGKDFVAGG